MNSTTKSKPEMKPPSPSTAKTTTTMRTAFGGTLFLLSFTHTASASEDHHFLETMSDHSPGGVPSVAMTIVAASILLVSALVYVVFQPAIRAASEGADAGAFEADLTPPTPPTSLSDFDSSGRSRRPTLSLVVPAYNERDRLPLMLRSTIDYLIDERSEVLDMCDRAAHGLVGAGGGGGGGSGGEDDEGFFEIIVVDDGSDDGTAEVVRDYASRLYSSNTHSDSRAKGPAAASAVRLRLVRLRKNSGKGAAVKAGMVRTNADLCLMVDADGATEFKDGLSKVLEGMCDLVREESDKKREANAQATQNGNSVGEHDPLPAAAVFGSRAHLEEASKAARSPLRTLLMNAFHFFVRALCSSSIKDTQCGFKLFTRPAVAVLFGNLHLRRWAFDTELVVLAENGGVPLSEVGVRWHEVDGSKLDTDKFTLACVSLGMLRDMVCVRACYALGIWRAKER